MDCEALYAATKFFHPFPNPESVFANRVDEHAQYLLPIATVALGHLRPEWSGEIHFVVPIEPADGWGLLGENSAPYHNYLCRQNWVGYRVIEGKYELACDFRYFHLAYYLSHPPQEKSVQEEFAYLPKYYQATRTRYESIRSHFQRHGWLSADPDGQAARLGYSDTLKSALVRNLGGFSSDGNWSNTRDFPISRYPEPTDATTDQTVEWNRALPQTHDGRDFCFIGEVELWNYIGASSGILVLFYDPVSQTVLTTIDWS